MQHMVMRSGSEVVHPSCTGQHICLSTSHGVLVSNYHHSIAHGTIVSRSHSFQDCKHVIYWPRLTANNCWKIGINRGVNEHTSERAARAEFHRSINFRPAPAHGYVSVDMIEEDTNEDTSDGKRYLELWNAEGFVFVLLQFRLYL